MVVIQKTYWANTCVQHNSWVKCDTLQGCNQDIFLGETKPMWWPKSTSNLIVPIDKILSVKNARPWVSMDFT